MEVEPVEADSNYDLHLVGNDESLKKERSLNKIFTIASFLTDPLFKAHQEITRIFLPLSHRKYWGVAKTENKIFEVFARVVWFFPMSTLGVVGSPFALIGIFFRTLGSCINPKGYLRKNNQKVSSSLNNHEIVFCNIGAPGGGESFKHVGVAPPFERMDKIVKLIKANQAKLLCLAEVYDKAFVDELIKRCEKLGYNDFVHSQGSGAFCPSGHFTAYKGNFLESPKFIPFTISTVNSQFFVKKGFSVYVANLKGRDCTIVQTHLYPSKNDEKPTEDEKEIRLKQARQIINHIKHKKNVIIIGDLNADPSEVKKLFPTAKRLKTNPTSATDALVNFVATGKKPNNPKENTIDHCLLINWESQNPSINLKETYSFENPEVSLTDHKLLSIS